MEQTPSSSGASPELPSVLPPSENEVSRSSSGSERQTGNRVELREQRSEASFAAERVAAPPVIPTTPPMVAPIADTASPTSPIADDTPLTASDDELIEKEWVENAKKIIAATKDDPYRREQEVTRLQADYLSKRYGRNLGSSE